MDNKGKRGFFFGSNNNSDIDAEFERMRSEMESLAKRMMHNLNIGEFERIAQDRANVMVHGFSIRVGPDGKPIIREFGNAKSAATAIGPVNPASPVRPGNMDVIETEREPLIDVIEGKDSIMVIAEVPGANEKDIVVGGSGKKLEIKSPKRSKKVS